MHLWLLFQRLRDFSHNKFAHQLKEELIENFNRIIKHEMDTVEVLKRYKKVEQIDNYLQAIRNNLDFHFHINGVSVTQPEFKLDALVWTCIFHEKVPRYSDVVYRMACYLLEHYRYLQTLQYTKYLPSISLVVIHHRHGLPLEACVLHMNEDLLMNG